MSESRFFSTVVAAGVPTIASIGYAWLRWPQDALAFTVGGLVIFGGSVLVGRWFTGLGAPVGSEGTLASVEQGDLTIEVTPDAAPGIFETLNRIFRGFARAMVSTQLEVDGLRGAAKQLGDTSRLLSEGAQNTKNQSGRVAAAAEQLSTTMGGISEAAESATARINNVSDSMSQMLDTVTEISRNAESTAATTGETASLVEDSSAKVAQLGEAVTEIGQIVSAIQEISEQTNLLALNATIEAERAGAMGKGFAVVASEVKALARQAASSSDDIRNRIGNIQKTTTEIVDSIKGIRNAINNVNDASTQIAAAVEEQNVTTGEVAKYVREAASSMGTVSKGISESAIAAQDISKWICDIDKGTAQTIRSAAKTQLAAESLSQLGDRLQNVVGEYELGDKEKHQQEALQNSLNENVPRDIRDSWVRAAGSGVMQTFYKNFLDSDPRIKPFFAQTDMNAQMTVLAKSMTFMLNYPTGDPIAARQFNLLGVTHSRNGMNIPPDLYSSWVESLIRALRQHDNQWSSELESSWRRQVAPGIEVMKNAYEANVNSGRRPAAA